MGKRKLLLVGLAIVVVAVAVIGSTHYRVTFTPVRDAGQPELARQISDIVTAYRLDN